MTTRKAAIPGGIAVVLAVALILFASTRSETPTTLALKEVVEATTATTAEPASASEGVDEPDGDTTEVETTGANARSRVSLGNSEPAVAAFTTENAQGPGPETTTTTTPTTSTSVAPVAAPVASGPQPVSIPRPSCASVGSPTTRTAPLTGLSASIPSNLPAVVVKVSNNNVASRASLVGLDQADIVFEERIEASATRFFSVFHSQTPPNVGPVRSGRTTDIQLAQNLNRPVFGYSGSNPGVAGQIQSAANAGQLIPFINTDRAPFVRDGRFRSPDNLFVDPLALGGCGGGDTPTSIFSYGANSSSAQSASSVSLSARSPYRFDWNGSAWVRSQDGSAHTTRTGAPLAPENVVVLFVSYVPSQIDAESVDAVTVGSGAAWVFRDGTVTTGSWNRPSGQSAYGLTSANGSAANLSPGQTWVVLAPAGTASWN